MVKKRFVLITMLLALLVGAAIAVPALAQTDGGGTPTPTPPPPSQTLMARVAAILGITEQKLNDAYAQAQREMADEALDRFLQKAVEKGRITQEQADQYKAWWNSRPQGLPGPFLGKGFGKHGLPPGIGKGSPEALLTKVATILGITEQKLKDAFAQVQREMQDEALDRFLQKAVEKGRITQEQADQYKAWWNSRPQGLPGPFMGNGFGKHGLRGMMKGLRHFRGHQPIPTPTPSASGTSF